MLSRALSGQHSVHWEYVNCLQTSTNTLPLHTHYCTERYWLSRSGTNRLTRSTWVHAHIYYGWAQVLTSTCSMNSSMCILSLQHWQTQLNGYTYALEVNFAATLSLDFQKYQHFKFERVVLPTLRMSPSPSWRLQVDILSSRLCKRE